MRLSLRAIFALVLVPLAMLACGAPDEAANHLGARTDSDLLAPLSTDRGPERIAQGALLSVDADAETITLMVNGAETTFLFTQDTEITGAVGRPQELAGQQGSMVSVRYREGSNGREAVNVRVESGGE